MGKIIVIRHGNRLDFKDPLWMTRSDPSLPTRNETNSPLSECGIQQAEDVAQYISTNYSNVKV
jgi:broad specificity phosphatase PhoE